MMGIAIVVMPFVALVPSARAQAKVITTAVSFGGARNFHQ